MEIALNVLMINFGVLTVKHLVEHVLKVLAILMMANVIRKAIAILKHFSEICA
jgi:hypothetical protein